MNELMSQAVELMIAGMGFVFTFLIILVFATLLMSKVIARYSDPEPASTVRSSRHRTPTSSPVDPDVAEAIRQAIAQYRSRHKK